MEVVERALEERRLNWHHKRFNAPASLADPVGQNGMIQVQLANTIREEDY